MAKKAPKKAIKKKDGRGVKPGTKRKPYGPRKEKKIVEPSEVLNKSDKEELEKFFEKNRTDIKQEGAPAQEEENNGEPKTDPEQEKESAPAAEQEENKEEPKADPEQEKESAPAAEPEENKEEPKVDPEQEKESAPPDEKPAEEPEYEVSSELVDRKEKKEREFEADSADGDLLFTITDFLQAPMAKGMMQMMTKKERREIYKKMDVEDIYLSDPQKKNIMKDPKTAEEVDKVFGGMHPLMKALLKAHIFYMHNAKTIAREEK